MYLVFQKYFCEWTSGNEKIDKFIQDAQLNAKWFTRKIEWIPYNRFKDIKEIAKGGFGTIYYAKWIDGYITGWDIEKKQWKRYGELEVVLKKFDNFENSNEEFLNKMSFHLKSGNEKIDKFIQDAQLNAKWFTRKIEWIPYNRFKDIKEIAKGGFGTIYYAKWIDGYITGWDIEKKQWKRYGELEVVLKKFDNFENSNEEFLNKMSFHLKSFETKRKNCFKGITKDPKTNKYMMVLEYMPDGNEMVICKGCGCKTCISCFINIFCERTSGNEKIDKFIQDAQLTASKSKKAIEWIPYHGFKGIKEIAKGGFGTIYYAKWIDGYITGWDIEKKQWKRYGEFEVVLKKFDNFENSNEEFLNEMSIHFKTNLSHRFIRFYGITKDPETNKYMMVLEYMPDGNFRDYLKNNFDNIDWDYKLYYLCYLAYNFKQFHIFDIVHQDFHPGNILSRNFMSDIQISDFGLSKIVGQSLENSNNRNIFGVLPYIAPEVLCGEEEYTKAADVYSFGIIAYELITGFAPYYDVPHDRELARKICNGLRPKIPFHTPKLITEIIMRSWDARITHRPTFEELNEKLYKYLNDYRENKFKNNNKITIQISDAKKFSKNKSKRKGNPTSTTPLNYRTHPEAIYTSRLLNYSNLPKCKNEENFEKELEEITKSVSVLSVVASKPINTHVP
ncbi:hypothetical protein Glove_707g70 [Diversispora epigaea]|uniref:Protein kinase domain-containing protein n=1 Tax=Diversispora epigaea TaxID=1348612 RepID=A0A397G4V7_9GLOM|nr:hypothetical protein Glove_707g70 [Diversispora epigaea]